MIRNARIVILDYLRLTASMCVCISHVLGALLDTNHVLSPLNKLFGYTAAFRVPLLFAISGFVICLSIRKYEHSVLTVCFFLVRRWIGITIPLCLALLFTYCYEKTLWLWGFPHVPHRTLIDVISNVFCLTSFTNTRRWIDPTWSLSYEFQYYIVTALLWMSSLIRYRKHKTVLQNKILIPFLLIISLVLDRMCQNQMLGIWHFRWFAIGLLAGIRFADVTCTRLFRSNILIVGMASIFEGGEYLGSTKLLLLAAILLFVETGGFGGLNNYIQSSPIFGTISYLIYLLHWPIGSHSGALVHLCRILSLQDDYWPMFAILIPLCVSVFIAKPVYQLCDWATNFLATKNQSNTR